MARPLMQRRIEQLEELFRTTGKDEKALQQLEHELGFRQAPRARALLLRVQAVLAQKSAQVAPTAATNAPTQGDLLAQNGQIDLPVPAPTEWKPRVPVFTPPPIRSLPPPPTTPTTEPLSPSMSAAEAYKVLGVPPSATWDVIELARRHIVQLAHPQRLASIAADKRAAAQAEARRANEACAAIRQARAE